MLFMCFFPFPGSGVVTAGLRGALSWQYNPTVLHRSVSLSSYGTGCFLDPIRRVRHVRLEVIVQLLVQCQWCSNPCRSGISYSVFAIPEVGCVLEIQLEPLCRRPTNMVLFCMCFCLCVFLYPLTQLRTWFFVPLQFIGGLNAMFLVALGEGSRSFRALAFSFFGSMLSLECVWAGNCTSTSGVRVHSPKFTQTSLLITLSVIFIVSLLCINTSVLGSGHLRHSQLGRFEHTVLPITGTIFDLQGRFDGLNMRVGIWIAYCIILVAFCEFLGLFGCFLFWLLLVILHFSLLGACCGRVDLLSFFNQYLFGPFAIYWSVMSVVYRRERGLVLALLTGLVAGQYLETRVAFGLCYMYIVILWFNTVIKLLRIKILLPFQNIGHMVYVGFFIGR